MHGSAKRKKRMDTFFKTTPKKYMQTYTLEHIHYRKNMNICMAMVSLFARPDMANLLYTKL